ncbi:MAG: hypothetical protein HKN34_06620, partial [Gammaproteobacteria bacterium]|nr:hypothetical protein [Gammaproteobacteria bacterium]
MLIFNRLFLFVVVLFILPACGGNGGGGSDISYTGIVADGYLQGATAFLDKNGNKVLDAGEPSAITDANGGFELASTTEDLATYSIVVNVPATAIDSDNGAIVGKAYTLSAPPGKQEFISPLTTLIDGLQERYPSLSVAQAEENIKAQLEIGDSASLFTNYITDGASNSATSGDSKKLHNVARVLAGYYGINTEKVKTSMGGIIQDSQKAEIATMLSHQAEIQLASLVKSVSDANLTDVEIEILSTFLKHVDLGDLEHQINMSRAATKTNFYDVVQGEGVYIAFFGPNGGISSYDRFYTTSLDRASYNVIQGAFFYSQPTDSFLPDDSPADPKYYLTPTGWLQSTDNLSSAIFSTDAAGNTTFTANTQRAVQSTTPNAIDLSCQLMKSYVMQGIDLADRTSRFPAGSIGYRLAARTGVDEYEIEADYADNPDLTTVASLSEIEVIYDPTGIPLKTSSALNIQFLSDGLLQFTDGRAGYPLALSGTWERKTVDSVEVLEINIPISYKVKYDLLDVRTDLFIAMVDGQARLGEVTRANLTDAGSNDAIALNQTAFDSVLAAAVDSFGAISTGGIVADTGYIEGANVFLDINENGVYDLGEPSDTTDQNGAYTLLWNNSNDLDAYPIVAAIPAGAKSYLFDVGKYAVVSQPYTLTAPAERSSFITPFSTFTWYLMSRNQGYTVTQAEADIKLILGLPGTTPVSSLTNYFTGINPGEEKIRIIAGMVADKFKEMRASMLANATG